LDRRKPKPALVDDELVAQTATELDMSMPWLHRAVAAALLTAAMPGAAHAAIKKVPYPEVAVETAAPHQPEAAFLSFWKELSQAVTSRNASALFALVGPTFVWSAQGALTDAFDPGRDALHNFKVVFGFRQQGRDEDGGVPNGPYWDELAHYVGDPTFYRASDKTSLICGPLLAEATDAAVLEQAQNKIAIGDDFGTWYFTAGDTPVAKSPGETDAPIGRLGKVAFPVLSAHPPAKDGSVPAATHYEVLLPSGATGWIAAGAARPLANDRLCYAKTRDDRWSITVFDQGQDD
jgi:hypothetical protein